MRLVVYSRRGCHLCEVMLEALVERYGRRAAIEVRDVDTRADWLQEYGERVPVLLHEGSLICQYVLDEAALQRLPDAASE